MKNQEAPPLTGPSEFGTSINVAVTPDVLQQDGASQSVVTITVCDADGQPLRNVLAARRDPGQRPRCRFRLLSARNVVTDANGRATLVYTAPLVPAASTSVPS